MVTATNLEIYRFIKHLPVALEVNTCGKGDKGH